MLGLYHADKPCTSQKFIGQHMYQRAKSRHASGMDISHIRRENLRAISAKMGGQARLADALDKSESQISQIIGKTPSRPIGNKQAREIEEILKLEFGELDRPPSNYPPLVQKTADRMTGLPDQLQQRIHDLVRDLEGAK